MEPSIGRSIRHGFRYANRAVLGMALLAGCWLVVSGLWQLTLGATGFPSEELQAVEEELQQSAQESAQPAEAPPAAATPDATPETPQQPESTEQQPAGSEPTAQTPEPTQPAEAEPADTAPTPPPAAPDPEERARLAEQERVEILQDWFADAWPALLGVFLLTVGLGLWLEGGQLGYLSQIAQTERGSVKEFLASGLRAFVPLLGTVFLSLLALAVVILLAVLVIALAGALGPAVGGIITMVLAAVGIVGWLWIMVRTVFWPTAIVLDRLGPIAAFKATWRNTRGRWWKLAGLGALLLLIFFGVGIVVGILGMLGAVGGPVGVALGWLAAILEFVANTYLGFVSAGAVIRFYLDAKAAQGASGSLATAGA